MVDGAEFWISCKRLKALRKASQSQLIKCLAPSTICWPQCDIRINKDCLIWTGLMTFFLLSGCKSTLRLHQTDWTTNSRFKWTEHQSNNWTSNPTLSAWCTNLGILTLAKNSWELIWMRNWLLQDKRRFVIIFWISKALTFYFKKSWKIKKIDLNTLIKVMINSRAGMNDKVWLLTKYFLGFFYRGAPPLTRNLHENH